MKMANLGGAMNDEHYKNLFDHAHDLIHIVEPDGKILYINKAWSKALEYNEEEISGRSIYSFVDEADRERFITYRTEILNGKVQDSEIMITLISKTGNRIIAEGFISLFYFNDQPQYTRGIFRDITARVNNERQLMYVNAELTEREENFQQLIGNAPDAIILIDADSKVLLWNTKAEKIFGWTEEEVMGKSITDIIIPPSYREAHTKGMQRYINTGEARVLNQTIEITALNKKGEEFFISLTISNYKRAGQNVFISFLRDITEQKRNQLELDRKKKELEESNHELAQYGWLTSHDLREPLRKILTYSDLMLAKEKDLPQNVITNIEKIHNAGKRMGSLIQSILFYTSLSGENDLYSNTNLNAIFEEVLTDLELIISENNVTIKKDDLPQIDAIPFQIRQLFQNLLSNAIKYRKPDVPPFITITSTTQENIATIVLRDNGIGFNANDKEKAFQLFQRLHTESKTEGTGVGLALCKKIVANHGGSITADSEPGKGSSFIIQLPVKHIEQ